MALLADGKGEELIGVSSVQLTRDTQTTFDDDSVTYEALATAVNGTVIPVSLRRTRTPLGTGDVVHYQLRDLRETKRPESENDEPGILRATERGLIGAGVRAITAGSATVALELLHDFEDIAVLITDPTMPDMTGLTLAEQVRALRPALPIILSTGRTGRVTTEQLQQVRIEMVLEKPYTLTQLTDAIQAALRSARRTRVTQRA